MCWFLDGLCRVAGELSSLSAQVRHLQAAQRLLAVSPSAPVGMEGGPQPSSLPSGAWRAVLSRPFPRPVFPILSPGAGARGPRKPGARGQRGWAGAEAAGCAPPPPGALLGRAGGAEGGRSSASAQGLQGREAGNGGSRAPRPGSASSLPHAAGPGRCPQTRRALGGRLRTASGAGPGTVAAGPGAPRRCCAATCRQVPARRLRGSCLRGAGAEAPGAATAAPRAVRRRPRPGGGGAGRGRGGSPEAPGPLPLGPRGLSLAAGLCCARRSQGAGRGCPGLVWPGGRHRMASRPLPAGAAPRCAVPPSGPGPGSVLASGSCRQPGASAPAPTSRPPLVCWSRHSLK